MQDSSSTIILIIDFLRVHSLYIHIESILCPGAGRFITGELSTCVCEGFGSFRCHINPLRDYMALTQISAPLQSAVIRDLTLRENNKIFKAGARSVMFTFRFQINLDLYCPVINIASKV